jgi:hypothetical protein
MQINVFAINQTLLEAFKKNTNVNQIELGYQLSGRIRVQPGFGIKPGIVSPNVYFLSPCPSWAPL